MNGKYLNILSGFSGLIIILIDLVFSIWASTGREWYTYIFNFALLYFASAMINNSFIQGITRGYSYLYLLGLKGLPKALVINLPAVILFVIAYFISKYVFVGFYQVKCFFIACMILSFFVAKSDNMFEVAIRRTKEFENVNDQY